MKKMIFWMFAALFIHIQAQDKKDVLMTVNGKPVTVGEFEYMYTKNLNLVKDPAQKDVDNYRKLFINYKLELADAHSKGLDTLPSFRSEYKRYRDELARKYLSDKKVTEKLVREAYKRMKTDVNVAHIMVMLPQDALPADTLKAWRKIQKIYKALKRGQNFNMLAKRFSEDPSAGENEGNLGWINVLQTVYPFETAAYNTPAGKFSKPFRTKYGYHIVYVKTKRPAVYRVQVKQIMIVKGKNPEAAKAKIFDIYKKIKQGEATFEDMAKHFSDDKQSAKAGGLLPPFGLRQKIPAFEEHAFALKKPDEISEPFETEKAWHILKLKQRIPVPPFRNIKRQLERQIERDSRSQTGKKLLLKRLKKQIPVTEKGDWHKVLPYIDDKFFEKRWHFPKQFKEKNKVLFVINNDKQVTYGDFMIWLYRHQRYNKNLAKYKKQEIKRLYDRFKDERLMQYYKDNLEKFNAEFARTAKEYYEGLLLFRYKSDNIWDKAMKDTLGLENYYRTHKEQYRTPPRYKAFYAETKDKSTAKKLLKALKKGASLTELEKIAGKQALVKTSIRDGKPEKIKPEMVKEGDKYVIRGIIDRVPSRIPSLDEIRGRVLGDYQQYLEKQLLEKLRRQYRVKINEKVWKKVRNKYKH